MDGGGTLRAVQGARFTRPALSTSPRTPRCAMKPAARAIGGVIGASATAVMPATCTTDISGIAAKLSTSPAIVTRENVSAAIGNSATSAHTDARKSAVTGSIQRGLASGCIRRDIPVTRPSVAPNVSANAASVATNGAAENNTAADVATTLTGLLR